MFAWACDPIRAASVGIDPFRMRAGIWLGPDSERRRQVIYEVAAALEASVAAHHAFSRNRDTIERVSVELGLRLQQVRLVWLSELSVMADGA